MFRRSLLVVGLLASLFSARADMMYYTFEGTVSSSIGAPSDFQVGRSVAYTLMLDFDRPGIQYNAPQNDYTQQFPYQGDIINDTLNYGSALIAPSSDVAFYPVNDVTPLYGYALKHKRTTTYPNSSEHVSYANSVFLYERYNSSEYNTFKLENGLSSSFQVGDVFSFREEQLRDFTYRDAIGSVTLRNISATLPVSSVPEPAMAGMLIPGLIMLSGFGLKRKKIVA